MTEFHPWGNSSGEQVCQGSAILRKKIEINQQRPRFGLGKCRMLGLLLILMNPVGHKDADTE